MDDTGAEEYPENHKCSEYHSVGVRPPSYRDSLWAVEAVTMEMFKICLDEP